jgi:hypothetical protein
MQKIKHYEAESYKGAEKKFQAKLSDEGRNIKNGNKIHW